MTDALTAALETLADPLAEAFHARLLALAPDCRRLLPAVGGRRAALFDPLTDALRQREDPAALTATAAALIARHAGHGVTTREWTTVAAALEWALVDVLADRLDATARATVHHALSMLLALVARAAGHLTAGPSSPPASGAHPRGA